jgi:hypothetical protein
MPSLSATLLQLEEARRRADSNRERRKIESVLQPQLAAVFADQGTQFLKKFTSLRGEFAESITADDWLPLWYSVVEGTEDAMVIPLEEAIETALYRGAVSQVAAFSLGIEFDLTNERAVAYLDGYAAKLVTGINETTRDYIQTIIVNGVRDGLNYEAMAGQIAGRFAEFAGKVRGPKHIRSRAELISVTEVGNAYSEGNRIIVLDMEAAGLKMQKAWLTRGDDRVSDGCRANQAAGYIDLNTAYPSGHQRPLRFPGCRCDEVYRRKPKGRS